MLLPLFLLLLLLLFFAAAAVVVATIVSIALLKLFNNFQSFHSRWQRMV